MDFRDFFEAEQEKPQELSVQIPLPKDVFTLSKVFRQGGHLLYVVGGAIRDFLMGQPSKDTDLATDATPQQVKAILTSAGIRNFEKGEAFGVWVAHLNGEDYEIATFREDLSVGGGRRPGEVKWSSPAADAKRRDLTMNALFYEIPDSPNKPGKILDYFGGQAIQDVKNKNVRVVGDPFDRFGEDRLRILRIPRFHHRFSSDELNLDPRTKSAIDYYKNLRSPQKTHKNDSIDPISGERIQQEFLAGIKKSLNTSSYIRTYINLGLLDSVFPGLNVDTENVNKLGNSKNIRVILAYLLRHNNADRVRNALNKLIWPNEITDGVAFLLKVLQKPNDMVKHSLEIQKRGMTGDVAEFGKILGNEVDQNIWQHLVSYAPPMYSGDEIMRQYGLKPGPEVGKRINQLHAQSYNQSFQNYLKQPRY